MLYFSFYRLWQCRRYGGSARERVIRLTSVCDRHYENGNVTPIVGLHGAGSLQVWQSKF